MTQAFAQAIPSYTTPFYPLHFSFSCHLLQSFPRFLQGELAVLALEVQQESDRLATAVKCWWRPRPRYSEQGDVKDHTEDRPPCSASDSVAALLMFPLPEASGSVPAGKLLCTL